MDKLEIHLYSRAGRPTTVEERAVEAVRTKLEKYARHLRRVGVRLDQRINNSGQLDQSCRVEVTLIKVLDSPKLLVEGRAPSGQEAAALAADAVFGAVEREVMAAQRRGRRASPRAKSKTLEVRRAEEESALENAEAIAREAEERHLTPRRVKTAHPQRGRHIHKTQRQSRATSAREAPPATGRPSRKSTRKSANRSKRDSNQARRNERDVRSPEAQATRARAGALRAGGSSR
jgi:hypothetical protein